MSEGDLPASARVGRVALVVSDLDELTEFYRDVVGLDVLERGRDSATLGADGTPLLELRADDDDDPGDRPPEAAGLFHVAFRVPDRAALGDALRRVRERWRLSGASDHRVSEALYLRDPDGNGVELYRDRERAAWPTTPDGRVEMDTLPLDLDALAAERTGTGRAGSTDGSGTGRAGSADGEIGDRVPPETDVGHAADGEIGDRVPPETDVGHVHLEVTDLAAARAFYVRVPPGTDVGHVHLEVTDLAAARAFYVDALGLAVRQEWGGDALFAAAGDYHHHVGLNTWNGRSEKQSGRGLAWFELRLPDADALDAAAARLRDAGFDVDELPDGFVVTDPDGIELRLRAA